MWLEMELGLEKQGRWSGDKEWGRAFRQNWAPRSDSLENSVLCRNIGRQHSPQRKPGAQVGQRQAGPHLFPPLVASNAKT